MNNIITDKWLADRNIILDKDFIEELRDFSITYKKTTSLDY